MSTKSILPSPELTDEEKNEVITVKQLFPIQILTKSVYNEFCKGKVILCMSSILPSDYKLFRKKVFLPNSKLKYAVLAFGTEEEARFILKILSENDYFSMFSKSLEIWLYDCDVNYSEVSDKNKLLLQACINYELIS